MRRIIFAMTSIFLFGSQSSCGHDAPTFTLDALFDSKQRAIIHRSANEWNAVLEEPITFNDDVAATTEHGQWRIVLMKPDEPFDGQCNNSRDKHGWARTIRIKPEVAMHLDALYPLIKHEMGHSVGMNHIDDTHPEYLGVMNHAYAESKFSQYDMSMCRSYGLCWRNDGR